MMIDVDFLKEAKDFAESDISPHAAQFDEDGGISTELIKKLASKGYLAATFPKEYGGMALNPVQYGMLTEEIGKACSSTRALLTVHVSLVGEALLRWGSEKQKQEWLPAMAKGDKIGAFALTEPETGSDASAIQTSYVKRDGEYVLSGRKKWITFSVIADFFLTIASNNGKASAFIVKRNAPGVTVTPIKGLLASRAAYIGEIAFDNVVVPEEQMIGNEGDGFTYIVNTALDHGRYSIAWAGLAIAQASLDAMVKYARERNQFGQKIYNYQLIQGMIADAVVKVHAGRSLCMHAASLRKNNHDDAVIETINAKYFTSKIAMEIATDAVQLHGGNGCYNEYPVERLFREAKILEIIEGSSQIQQGIISRFGLRRYYKI